ncbi:hypothetical protein BHE74_00007782 [Ensete ventricosum]|nr:hypothetical protein BHE74_00007782 [Ensete ventricosum]RZS11958.1 hypothetical protein BHM03_00043336 [Ensete ventricosum]
MGSKDDSNEQQVLEREIVAGNLCNEGLMLAIGYHCWPREIAANSVVQWEIATGYERLLLATLCSERSLMAMLCSERSLLVAGKADMAARDRY